MTSRQHRFLILLIILAFFAGTLVLSRHRPIDGDEGYYATAARLVSEGQTPYLDFFYPQMPLLPYLYAPVYKLAGSSLVGMRLFSVLLGALSLVLWGLILQRRWPERPAIVLGGLALVAMNPYFLSWNVTVKTFALTNLSVFATLWALDRGLQSRRWSWFVLAGAAAGLGVGVRLLYLPWAGMLALALVWLGMRGMEKRLRPGRMVAYIGGMLVGLVPSAVFFALDPDRFFFNNFSYHQLRFSSLGRAGTADGVQAWVALQVLGKALFLNPFMFFQLVLVGFGVDWTRRNPDSSLRPLMIISSVGAVAHTVTCLFPDPVYEQYFTGPLTPLLAPLVVAGLVRLTELVKRPAVVVTVVLCLGAMLSAVDLQVHKTGMNWKEVWSFEHLAKVSTAIEARTEPEDIVLAFWPGYVFETGRQYLPGLENHFALGVSEKLTVDEKVHYHVAGKELVLKAFDLQYPDVVVLGAWMHELNTTIDQRHLPIILEELEAKYQLEEYYGETRILSRKPVPGSGLSCR
ncbi:MAG: glycosyltransferase family 39 protein [Candidatus Krumholzibacteria bacterium]|nr:glycosyltransferase family 39 protein [Candidatus Krumholzibacteria bacterium]